MSRFFCAVALCVLLTGCIKQKYAVADANDRMLFDPVHAWKIQTLSPACRHTDVVLEFHAGMGWKIVLPKPGRYTLSTRGRSVSVTVAGNPLQIVMQSAMNHQVIFVTYRGKVRKFIPDKCGSAWCGPE